jgi:N-carbamoyl-L-amino-acid hydrolase
VVELRLNDKFGVEPTLGNPGLDWQEALARHSDPGYAEKGQLTVTYLTDAHRAGRGRSRTTCARCGFDEVAIDAVGNVVGRYRGARRSQALLTGSHYDTVRNGGKYDGRLGIFTPMACVRELARPAAACRSASRWSASPRRKASATRRPSSAPAR